MPIGMQAVDKSSEEFAEGEKQFQRRQEEQKRLGKGLSTPWNAAAAGAHAADTASTLAVLGAGGKEENPALSLANDNPILGMGLKLGIAAGVQLAANQLAKKGKTGRTVGKIVSAVNTIGPAAAAAHNVGSYKRLKNKGVGGRK